MGDICCVGGPVDDRPSAEEPIVLEREVCPAGKHQGKTFLEVLEDRPFCLWIVKEPRRGWMGLINRHQKRHQRWIQRRQPRPRRLPPLERNCLPKVVARVSRRRWYHLLYRQVP